MPFFSRRKKSQDSPVPAKPAPAPYRHIPTHAAADALMGIPAKRGEEDRQAIREAHNRRQSMMEERRMSRSISSTRSAGMAHSQSYSGIPTLPRTRSTYSVPSLPRSGSTLSTVMTIDRSESHLGMVTFADQRQRPMPSKGIIRNEATNDRQLRFPFQEPREPAASGDPYASSSSPSTPSSSLESSPLELAMKPTSVKFKEHPVIIDDVRSSSITGYEVDEAQALGIQELHFEDADLYLEATAMPCEEPRYSAAPPIPPRMPRPVRPNFSVPQQITHSDAHQYHFQEHDENWPLGPGSRIPPPSSRHERRQGMMSNDVTSVRIEEFGNLLKQPDIHV